MSGRAASPHACNFSGHFPGRGPSQPRWTAAPVWHRAPVLPPPIPPSTAEGKLLASGQRSGALTEGIWRSGQSHAHPWSAWSHWSTRKLEGFSLKIIHNVQSLLTNSDKTEKREECPPSGRTTSWVAGTELHGHPGFFQHLFYCKNKWVVTTLPRQLPVSLR